MASPNLENFHSHNGHAEIFGQALAKRSYDKFTIRNFDTLEVGKAPNLELGSLDSGAGLLGRRAKGRAKLSLKVGKMQKELSEYSVYLKKT